LGLKEAGQRYGRVSYNAVAKASSRFYERFKKDRKLNRKIKKILSNVQIRPLFPTQVDALLTFCPPLPPEQMKDSSISPSLMPRDSSLLFFSPYREHDINIVTEKPCG
jgi:hypothetical protein